MIRSLLAGILAGLLLAAAPKAPLAAQSTGLVGITPYAGYMKFGNYRAVRSAPACAPPAPPMYGAEAAARTGPGLALVGNVAYAKSDLEVGAPLIGGRLGGPELGADVRRRRSGCACR